MLRNSFVVFFCWALLLGCSKDENQPSSVIQPTQEKTSPPVTDESSDEESFFNVEASKTATYFRNRISFQVNFSEGLNPLTEVILGDAEVLERPTDDSSLILYSVKVSRPQQVVLKVSNDQNDYHLVILHFFDWMQATSDYLDLGWDHQVTSGAKIQIEVEGGIPPYRYQLKSADSSISSSIDQNGLLTIGSRQEVFKLKGLFQFFKDHNNRSGYKPKEG